MNAIQRKGLHLLSIPFAAAPFAIAVLRAVRSGLDPTMLGMAVAAFAGAGAVMLRGRARHQPRRTVLVLSAAAFLSSALCAVLAGRLLGAVALPGLIAVAVAFGLSSAIGLALDALARAAG